MGFGMNRHTWEQIKSCKEVRHYTNTIVEVLMFYLLHFSRHTHTCIHTQANMVFDGMKATSDFSGYVVFLEEDHYLSPDFLYVTEKLIALKEE